jgi:hypothetical protein
MSDFEYEDESDAKPTKKQITDAQRKARIENLRKGRETRAKNVEMKKAKQMKASQKQQYEVRESDSDSESETESDSSDSEIELEITRKPKAKPSKAIKSTRYEKPHRSSEIDELKAEIKAEMAALLKQQRKKKNSRTKKTIINVAAPTPVQTQSNNPKADFYKSKLLEL